MIDDILKKVFDSLNVAVVVLDEDNQIILFNRMAGELLQQDGVNRVGTSILRCHPKRAEPGVLKMINEMKSGKLEKYEGWVNYIGRILYEHIYPIRDAKGNYLATVVELRDAGERAKYLESIGEFTLPEEHGAGESSPRSPHSEKPVKTA
ncbi:MAG: PAS domain-containing protein [Candidatus Thorarchaeota archaeon]|jgi:DUF438 domain-containing protein